MADNSPNAKPRAAMLTNVVLLEEKIVRCKARAGHLPGLIVFHGPSGIGKSVAAALATAQHDAVYVACKSTWTKSFLLKAILFELGIPAERGNPEMTEQIGRELAASGRPLIIDEADHLIDRGNIEIVRDIYEASLGVIILIGEELLPRKIQRYERIHNRVFDWVPGQFASVGDARELVRLYVDHVVIAEDLLDFVVTEAGGRPRRIAVNLDRIQDEAMKAGVKTADRKWWGTRPLFTGDAPSRKIA